jgi:oxygen-independent coproporphyrinogen-3 oxidase
MDLLKWESNLKQALALPIQHLSAYHLTYEPGTIFHHWKKKGKITEINEKQSIEQYHLLKKLSEEKGYEHYEISNFSKPGYRSKHNSTYWNGSKYFGFGPGAHSYIGDERRWNASSLKLYINNLKTGEKYFSSEQLSRTDKFNDHLITRLRTKEGVDGRYLIKTFGEQTYNELLEACNEFILSNDLRKEGHTIWMTPEGWLKSDMIISKLML